MNETSRKLPRHLNGKDSVTLVSHTGEQRRRVCAARPGSALTGFCLLERIRGGGEEATMLPRTTQRLVAGVRNHKTTAL